MALEYILFANPHVVIEEIKTTPRLGNVSWFNKLIEQETFWATKEDPLFVLTYAKKLDDLDFGREAIIEALTTAEKTNYNFFPYLRMTNLRMTKVGSLVELPYTEPFIRRLANKLYKEEPNWLFQYYDSLQKFDWFPELLTEAVKNDPGRAITFHDLFDKSQSLLKSNDPAIQSMQTIYEFLAKTSRGRYENPLRMAALLENIVKDDLYLEDAFNISQNPTLFFRSLLNIKNKDNHLGKFSVEYELNNICLRLVEDINSLHDQPDTLRFKSVENSSSDELYALITYGENEIYTSSFNGLFNRMLTRLKTDDVKGDQFLAKVRHDKFRTFIRLCAQFGRLPDFLATMTPTNCANLMKRFAEGLDREPDKLIQAVAVAESLALFDDPALLEQVKSMLQKEYERVQQNGDREGEMLYRLLLDKHHLPEVAKLPAQELFNTDGVNIQQVFFYNDQDGQASFNHFVNSYRSDRHWQIKDHGPYVCLVGKKNDKTIEIYANKPAPPQNLLQKDMNISDGFTDIRNTLNEKKIDPTVYIHRRHSYHTDTTQKYIAGNARFIFFGSCGGYRELEAIYQRAPQAQFFGKKF